MCQAYVSEARRNWYKRYRRLSSSLFPCSYRPIPAVRGHKRLPRTNSSSLHLKLDKMKISLLFLYSIACCLLSTYQILGHPGALRKVEEPLDETEDAAGTGTPSYEQEQEGISAPSNNDNNFQHLHTTDQAIRKLNGCADLKSNDKRLKRAYKRNWKDPSCYSFKLSNLCETCDVVDKRPVRVSVENSTIVSVTNRASSETITLPADAGVTIDRLFQYFRKYCVRGCKSGVDAPEQCDAKFSRKTGVVRFLNITVNATLSYSYKVRRFRTC